MIIAHKDLVLGHLVHPARINITIHAIRGWIQEALFSAPVVNGTGGLRVDIDTSAERMQKKIRDAQLKKIPYMLVVGEREAADGKVAVRLRSGKDLGAMPLETFIERIKTEAESRKDVAE